MPVGPGKDIDEVYRDRNLLALALAVSTSAPSAYHDDPEAEGWSVVWIQTPNGEVSWHAPTELVERFGLRYKEREYTGYSREAKNDMLASWIKAGCPT